jgi:hypothetical protein
LNNGTQWVDPIILHEFQNRLWSFIKGFIFNKTIFFPAKNQLMDDFHKSRRRVTI